jgi:hypothetical protein
MRTNRSNRAALPDIFVRLTRGIGKKSDDAKALLA